MKNKKNSILNNQLEAGVSHGGTAREGVETKWTKGPWSVEDPHGPDTFTIVPADKPTYQWTSIALIPRDDEPDPGGAIDATQQLANAHLIAAAPELYEALKEVVALSDRKQHAWDNARAALAKARGER